MGGEEHAEGSKQSDPTEVNGETIAPADKEETKPEAPTQGLGDIAGQVVTFTFAAVLSASGAFDQGKAGEPSSEDTQQLQPPQQEQQQEKPQAAEDEQIEVKALQHDLANIRGESAALKNEVERLAKQMEDLQQSNCRLVAELEKRGGRRGGYPE